MKATAQFDQARHSISIEHQVMVMRLKYEPFAEHAKRFHGVMASRFCEMHHVVGTDRSYDPIYSDA